MKALLLLLIFVAVSACLREGPLEDIALNRGEPQLAQAWQHYDAGETHRKHGRQNQAVAEYDAALRLYSRFAEACVGRGLAYAKLGQPGRAIEDYQQSVRLDPDIAQAYSA